jgi:hypothetical protein
VEQLEDRSLPSVSPLTLGEFLVHNVDFDNTFVTQQYQTFLQRTPNSAELGGWVRFMRLGASEEQVQAAIASSPEAAGHDGGFGAGWLTGLYRDFLGRVPSQSELDGWMAQLAAGASPFQVALGFATSPEREAIVIRADYQSLLGRLPDPSEVALWQNNLQHGLDQAGMEAFIVASPEFVSRSGGTDAAFITNAYESVIGRPPTTFELHTWLGFKG